MIAQSLPRAVSDYYRCPSSVSSFDVAELASCVPGYFSYSQRKSRGRGLALDVDDVVENIRYERYAAASGPQMLAQDVYYRLRPLIPSAIRKYFQKMYFRERNRIDFPAWPVDRSVDLIMERSLMLSIRTLRIDRLPFIWFWPDGHQACAILTHDVETVAGRNSCSTLMDIDDRFDIKASFQIVPEKRYEVSHELLEIIRSRGFEVNVHGLDHEGNLFRSRETFLSHAQKINQYARQFGALGFRSPVLYRNADWFQDMNFSYDMSVPNTARLEVQRGGCCTVMPYFLPGDVLELPLTTSEDYTILHMLNDYSMHLWKQQINITLSAHGLMTFLVHPDYIGSEHARGLYERLLQEIDRLRSEQAVWVTLPREVNRWWRERSAMVLKPHGRNWTIHGIGSERAKVAYACLDGDRLVYEFDA